MTTLASGSCLCGKVRFEISGDLGIFQYCHCSRCRKISGSAHSANLMVVPQQLTWLQGEASVGRFEHPEAKYFASAFCRECGSALPWLTKTGTAVMVPAGSLDDDPQLRPQQNIYWGSRAPWYQHVDSLPLHDALPQKPI